jgi:hypothetical protein
MNHSHVQKNLLKAEPALSGSTPLSEHPSYSENTEGRSTNMSVIKVVVFLNIIVMGS